VRWFAARYDYQDDAAVRRAGSHAASLGFYRREDFLVVVGWKSARSVPMARRNSSADVMQATCAALDPVDERSRMVWLTRLAGVGVPVGSALLHFAMPDRYPILDYRALESLGERTRRSQYSVSFWLRYVDRCQHLARAAGVSIRELDKALWQASRESDARRDATMASGTAPARTVTPRTRASDRSKPARRKRAPSAANGEARVSLVPGAMWPEMLPALRRLPGGRLGREVLLSRDFLLAREGRLAVYWIPFERLNTTARVILLGLTPGFQQMAAAYAAARDALHAGESQAEMFAHVSRRAAFVGAMRTNLVAMLDAVGLADALDLGSTIEFFDARADLVHMTSALRYPVFANNENYSGRHPRVTRSTLLTHYVNTFLIPELRAVPDALIVPLGKSTEECVWPLVNESTLEQRRCLLGFPHPSGANVGRLSQLRANAPALRRTIRAWSRTL
jgi:hypothetical protein